MRKIPFNKRPALALKWLWLAVSFKSPRLLSFEPEQGLLFSGASCKLIWKTKNVLLVKVHVNQRFIGSFLPKEVPVISPGVAVSVTIKVYGVYKVITDLINMVVEPRPLMSRPVCLAYSSPSPPLLIKELHAVQATMEPVNVGPVIKIPGIHLETKVAARAEKRLIHLLQNHKSNNNGN